MNPLLIHKTMSKRKCEEVNQSSIDCSIKSYLSQLELLTIRL